MPVGQTLEEHRRDVSRAAPGIEHTLVATEFETIDDDTPPARLRRRQTFVGGGIPFAGHEREAIEPSAVLVFGSGFLEIGNDHFRKTGFGKDDLDPFGLGDDERFPTRRVFLAERAVPPRLVRERPAFGTVRNRARLVSRVVHP